MKKSTLIFILLILVFSPILAFSSTDFPDFPMAFYGNARLDNNSLPTGTKIQTYCGSNLINEIVLKNDGIYGSPVSQEDRLLASYCESDIIFKYLLSGSSIALTGEEVIIEAFVSGETKKKNLNFKTASQAPSSAGGGGGGGQEPKTEKTKGDITGDGKVGIFDFNILMANWGKTGENVADLNGDGKVDILDFNILMINWTK